MPIRVDDLLKQYVNKIKGIYGSHLKTVILYGSYARGDYREDSDIIAQIECQGQVVFSAKISTFPLTFV